MKYPPLKVLLGSFAAVLLKECIHVGDAAGAGGGGVGGGNAVTASHCPFGVLCTIYRSFSGAVVCQPRTDNGYAVGVPRKLIVWHAGARGNDVVGSIITQRAVYPIGVADGATVPGGAVGAGVFGCHTGGVVGAGGAHEFIPVITLVTGLYIGGAG